MKENASTTNTRSTKNGNSPNGTARLPKASDYKLPKKLTAQQKRRIETSRAILEEFRKVREGEYEPEK